MKNYYQTLGLSRDASSREIRKRTLYLGKRLHSKMQQSEVTNESPNFVDVVEACEVLYQDDARIRYDVFLDNHRGTKTMHADILERHQKYINAISQRGRKRGEFYAISKWKEFKEDYQMVNWWDITGILQHIMP